MKKLMGLMIVLSLAFAATAMAANYGYVEPEQFKQWLESGKPMQVLDIQVPAEFQKHHFKGALETNAFPVKTAEEKKRLDLVIPKLAASREDIVVVCPRGGGGAKNTYDYLKEQGVAEKRIYILKDGMQGWPFKETMVVSKK